MKHRSSFDKLIEPGYFWKLESLGRKLDGRKEEIGSDRLFAVDAYKKRYAFSA